MMPRHRDDGQVPVLKQVDSSALGVLMMMGFNFMARMAMVVSSVFFIVGVIVFEPVRFVNNGVAVLVVMGMAVSVPMDQVPVHVLMTMPMGVFMVV